MASLEERILSAVRDKAYRPVKERTLAADLGLDPSGMADFRRSIKELLALGLVRIGSDRTIRGRAEELLVRAIYKRLNHGDAIAVVADPEAPFTGDIWLQDGDSSSALTGDVVMVRVIRRPTKVLNAMGEVAEIALRATRQFVGTLTDREGTIVARIDGNVFRRSVEVGDISAKNAVLGDKVLVEILKFPDGNHQRGEGVILEVLGRVGDPGVDTLTVIRTLGIPDVFSQAVLEEALAQVEGFDDTDLDGRTDFSDTLVITIDPVDAKDFDDAISLIVDEKTGHIQLTVHIADVAHFVKPGSALDHEAKTRGTSVYLPQRVIPMLPEAISNNLASLQEGKLRYVLSAVMDFTPAGVQTDVRFHRGAIRVRKRFAYEQVSEIFKDPGGEFAKTVDPAIVAVLLDSRALATVLRRKRFEAGALELEMPETKLEYDANGRITGARFAVHDESHRLIEEFMLTANEAVARFLSDRKIAFLRRIHPAPAEDRLKRFGKFAASLGYEMENFQNRFEIQKVLAESADQPERRAIHYALLRSFKQAIYSPWQDEHFALAMPHYCHFTSPIRRYPDLLVHRLITQFLKKKRLGSDEAELESLAESCSKTERRAEAAERDLVKLRLLMWLSANIGMEMDAVITGVNASGFFAQGATIPAEGFVHVKSLGSDFFYFDEANYTLEGTQSGRAFRLGDEVRVRIERIDMQRRGVDFSVIARTRPASKRATKPKPGKIDKKGKKKKRK